jgi:hypothetical protein
MAGDLVEEPSTLQTFSHDLESAFFVILYLACYYRKTNYSEDKRSIFYHSFLNVTACGDSGSPAKSLFMKDGKIPFIVDDNPPLTSVLCRLIDTLRQRYFADRKLTSVFLDLQTYNALACTHDHIIQVLDDALQPTDPKLKWPLGDFAMKQRIGGTNEEAGNGFISSRKSRSSRNPKSRGRPDDDDSCPSSSKRQKSGSLA